LEFPDLRPVLTTLQWAVIGGVVTRLYMPERATQDLDIVVRREDGGQARATLAAAGFRYQSELWIGGSSWSSPNGMNLDVVEMEATWLGQALEETQFNRDAQGFPVLPLAYLVLIKFESGKVQDLADVTRMLGQADLESLEVVKQVLAEHLPDEIDDLESLILLGKMESGPP
jgi:hypothetical protein